MTEIPAHLKDNDISILFKAPEPTKITPAPRAIRKALIDATQKIESIEKRGQNNEEGYSFVRSADVVAAVTKACNESRLIITQHVVGVWQDPSQNMVVGFEFLIQLDDDDADQDHWVYPGMWLGVADDWETGRSSDAILNDKWFNMAATAAQKYFYMKLFKIETTESATKSDPDQGRTESGPRTASPRGSKATEDLRQTYRHVVSQIEGATSERDLKEITCGKDFETLVNHSKNTKEDLAGRVAKRSDEISRGE